MSPHLYCFIWDIIKYLYNLISWENMFELCDSYGKKNFFLEKNYEDPPQPHPQTQPSVGVSRSHENLLMRLNEFICISHQFTKP